MELLHELLLQLLLSLLLYVFHGVLIHVHMRKEMEILSLNYAVCTFSMIQQWRWEKHHAAAA